MVSFADWIHLVPWWCDGTRLWTGLWI